MKTILVLFLLCWITFSVRGADDVVQPRDGVPNFFRKLIQIEKTPKNAAGDPNNARVVFFGGSITAGAGASKPELCYRELLYAKLKSLHPTIPLFQTNAALGGTGSWLGVFRMNQDVFDHWVPADLCIVEFAVNDNGTPDEQTLGSMEGIVRKLRGRYPEGDILFVYTLAKDQMEFYKKGELPPKIITHEKIAAHYGIPSVNVGGYAAKKILAGELTMEEFAKDGVHPTDRGYALYLEALLAYLTPIHDAAVKSETEKPGEPLLKKSWPKEKFSARSMDNAKMVPYDVMPMEGEWKLGQEPPAGSGKFLHTLAGDKAGATVTVRFKGDSLGYYDVIGPDTGDLEFSADGGEWKPRSNWDVFCKEYYRQHCRVVVEGLDPAAEHTVKIRIAAKKPDDSKGQFFRPAFFLVNGEALDADPYKGLDPLAKIDGIYKKMEPVQYTPPAERWALIPNMMKRLQEGPSLKIVMLGDSIIGDTSSSKYELLLGRMYPKCKIEKQTSTRGSTGCWWYKDENRVEEWVLKHKPDVLMIGGISQRGDIEAIRSVIQQCRAKGPLEVILMTNVFGTTKPKTDADWTEQVPATGYRADLKKLAADEKCEFIDMTGPWGKYIKDSDKVMGYFKRDPIHANERGFQILGRILEKYFSPK